jgi:SAM-dependent methyltransferase
MHGVSFEVVPDAYGQFMGRYSEPLAVSFAAFAGVAAGQRVLDVGCGPGALSGQLVPLLGAGSVSAVDPSETFVAAARQRFPGVDVRLAVAENLPFGNDTFDAALAQLVVHFMDDPVAGLAEMTRVTRSGGTVAACVWDHAGDGSPLAAFWRAVNSLDPGARDESGLAGAREGHLAELLSAAGLRDITSTALTVRVSFPSFEAWWTPYTLGVGPAGDYVQGLDLRRLAELKERCASSFPAAGPFEVAATAWAAAGLA